MAICKFPVSRKNYPRGIRVYLSTQFCVLIPLSAYIYRATRDCHFDPLMGYGGKKSKIPTWTVAGEDDGIKLIMHSRVVQ